MSAALDLLGGLILEDGRRWADAAEPWQWSDAEAVLDVDDGPPMHFLTRPRGASKTTDLAGIGCAALLAQLPPSARAYAVAADRDQARLLVDALAGFVARTPGLAGAIRVDQWRAATTAGATLEVLAADGPSAFGIRPHLLIVDELSQWPTANRSVWTAVVSAVPKVAGCRLVCLSSAGDPAHWSAKVREQARTSPRWRLHEVVGPCPWVSADALDEQRALLTDSQYARLHLNIWTASEDRLVSPEGLAAAVTLDGPQEFRPGVTYAIGADVGLRHDRTAIVVAHAEWMPETSPPARRVVLDRLVVFSGSRAAEVSLGDVEEALLTVWRTYGKPRLRMDPWQAIGLAQRLKAKGVRVEEWSYSAARYGAAASALFGLLRDGLLALYPDEGLLDELATVRLRETLPGQVRVDHDSGKHDDMAQALGFAVTALLERGEPARARTSSAARLMMPSRSMTTDRGGTGSVLSNPSGRSGTGRVLQPGDPRLRHLPGPHRGR